MIAQVMSVFDPPPFVSEPAAKTAVTH
jgi:hypothetical protein